MPFTLGTISSIFLMHCIFWYFIDLPLLIFSSGLSGLSIAILIPIYKGTKNIKLISHIVILIVLVSVAHCSLVTYEHTIVVTIWLFMLPLGSLIFLDKKSFYFWSLLVFLTISSLPIIHTYFPFTVNISKSHTVALNLLELSLQVGTNFIMLYMYRDLIFSTLESLSKQQSRLNKTTNKLRKSQKYKDQFFANMSHELRTPMNAIKGISELLRSSTHEDQKLVEHLRDSTHHLIKVVDDLIDFTKMQEGKVHLNIETVDFKKLTEQTFQLLQILAESKNLIYQLTIKPNIPRYLRGDPNRISQVLINVLSNAIKYTPAGGKVALVCELLQIAKRSETPIAKIHVKVTDTGIGISEQDLKNIYQDYFRSASVLDKDISGAGLGLYITKYLIDAMQGSIKIESRLNQGTQVYIKLPLEMASAQSTEGPLQAEAKDLKYTYPIKVLVVDDNHLNLTITKKHLERKLAEGSEIYTAVNGRLAIDSLERLELDLIIMDMVMPEINGVEATKIIRSLPQPHKRNIPIIGLTANVGEEDINKCLESGMNEVLLKPLDLNRIFHILPKYVKVLQNNE